MKSKLPCISRPRQVTNVKTSNCDITFPLNLLDFKHISCASQSTDQTCLWTFFRRRWRQYAELRDQNHQSSIIYNFKGGFHDLSLTFRPSFFFYHFHCHPITILCFFKWWHHIKVLFLDNVFFFTVHPEVSCTFQMWNIHDERNLITARVLILPPYVKFEFYYFGNFSVVYA